MPSLSGRRQMSISDHPALFGNFGSPSELLPHCWRDALAKISSSTTNTQRYTARACTIYRYAHADIAKIVGGKIVDLPVFQVIKCCWIDAGLVMIFSSKMTVGPVIGTVSTLQAVGQ
jgi:hypothetical protein